MVLVTDVFRVNNEPTGRRGKVLNRKPFGRLVAGRLIFQIYNPGSEQEIKYILHVGLGFNIDNSAGAPAGV